MHHFEHQGTCFEDAAAHIFTPHQSELASKEGRLRKEGRGHGAAGEAAAVHGCAACHGSRHVCILHDDLHPRRRPTLGSDILRTLLCSNHIDGVP